jgi:hypothetical protein
MQMQTEGGLLFRGPSCIIRGIFDPLPDVGEMFLYQTKVSTYTPSFRLTKGTDPVPQTVGPIRIPEDGQRRFLHKVTIK